MFRSSLLWILLLLGVVGVAVWWQADREEQGLGQIAVRLFEGVETERVTAIRIENVERAYIVRLERDGGGRWYTTEPTQRAADSAVVAQILEMVRQNRGAAVPKAEEKAAASGFDPPRIYLDVFEDVDGTQQRHRVEIGALDIDGMRVNVRVDGQFLRTPRNLDNTFVIPIEGYQSRRIFDFAGARVIGLERRGSWPDEADPLRADLTLEALLDGDGWQIAEPVAGKASDAAIELLVHSVLHLEARRAIGDAGEDLARFGLAEPAAEVELLLPGEGRLGLELGYSSAASSWYVRAKDTSMVWLLEPRDHQLLLMPAEMLYEPFLVRAELEEVRALELLRTGESVRLERLAQVSPGAEAWQIRTRRASEEWGPAGAANGGAVEDLLTAMMHEEVLGSASELQGPGPHPSLPHAEQRGLSFRCETPRGVLGGAFGGATKTAEGLEAEYWQRSGDALWRLVRPEVVQLLEMPAEDLRSKRLWTLNELQLSALTVESGERSVRFIRDDKGRWRREGSDTLAAEIYGVLDALLFLRVGSFVSELPTPRGEVLSVRFETVDGEQPVAQFLSAGEGEWVGTGGAWGSAERAALRGELRALLDQ